jgi:hypothetical protein
MTKKLLEYPSDNTKFDPLRHLFKIRTWGTKWKRVVNKTVEWVAWRWANAKVDKKSISVRRQSVNIFKEDMEDYNLVMFTHAMDFFKEHVSLKRSILEHFFTNLLNNFSTKDLLTLGIIHKSHESLTTTLCNFKYANFGSTRIEEQSLKTTG